MNIFKELCKLTAKAAVEYQMIRPGDRILLGLSGGKDSFVLAHALHEMRRRAPFAFDIVLGTFDPMFPEFGIAEISAYCQKHHFEHQIIRLDIPAVLAEKNIDQSPCVLCSRLRRGHLYKLAAAQNCNKLALGQHFDDMAASFLMSLCRGQGLSTMAPVVRSESREKLTIIRPLIYVEESMIKECTKEFELPATGKCRYEETVKAGDRAYFRSQLELIKERIPHLKGNMLKSLANVQVEHLLDKRFIDAQ